ncbi:MAG: polysaccharide biosynthesis C-terminal domain-containing protein [Clostridium sp.]
MIKNIIKTLFSNVSSLIISFITSVIIARVLGPEGNGQLGAIILIPSTLYIVLSGQYFGDSQYFTKKGEYSKEFMISSSLLIYAVLTIVEIVMIFSYCIFSNIPNLVFVILMIVVLNLNLFVMPFLIAIDQIKAKNLLTVASAMLNAAQMIMLMIIWKDKITVQKVVITQLTTFAVIDLIGMYIILKKKSNKLDFSIRKNFEIIKSIFGFVKSCYISNVANFLNFRLDQWLLILIKGNVSLGIYSVAVNLAEKLWIIPDSIAAILYPEISSRDEYSKVIKSINKVIVMGLIIGGIGWILTFLVLDTLVILVYTKAYISVSNVIKILFPGIVMFSISKIITCFLSGIGKPELRVIPSVVGTVSNLILNIIMIPKWGIYGAAISTTISYSIYGVWILIVYINISKKYMIK